MNWKSNEFSKGLTQQLLAPSDIQHSSTTSLKLTMLHQKKTYISRPSLEHKITSIVNKQEPTDMYVVVYGPKGVGKSVLVDKCVHDKKGVVKLCVSEDGYSASALNQDFG